MRESDKSKSKLEKGEIYQKNRILGRSGIHETCIWYQRCGQLINRLPKNKEKWPSEIKEQATLQARIPSKMC